MEYVELDEDGYGKLADGSWVLTPKGLAQWADEEGGWESLFYGKGGQPFLEAGVNPSVLQHWVDAMYAMEQELDRIGAVM